MIKDLTVFYNFICNTAFISYCTFVKMNIYLPFYLSTLLFSTVVSNLLFSNSILTCHTTIWAPLPQLSTSKYLPSKNIHL